MATFSNLRVFVTGASGMIGAKLVERLVELGADVYALTRSANVPPRLIASAPSIHILSADLCNPPEMHRILAEIDPEIVFHLASTPLHPPPKPETHFDVNVGGTYALLSAFSEKPPRVILTGSAAQYGSGEELEESQPERPIGDFAMSKSAAATILRTYGRQYEVATMELRLFTPYGEGERAGRLIPSIVLDALEGREVRIGSGIQIRDYVHIDDVVDALLMASEIKTPGHCCFNICSGEPRTVRQVAEMILTILNNSVELKVGALPDRKDDIAAITGLNFRAEIDLGWRPKIAFASGLRNTVEWIVANADFVRKLR